jgi:putative hemolysin
MRRSLSQSVLFSIALVACSPAVTPSPTAPTSSNTAQNASRASDTSGDASKILAAIQSAVDAKKQQPATYKGPDGADVAILHFEELRLNVSVACVHADGKIGCDALTALSTITGKSVTPGPGNPASYYCPAAGGTSVMLTDNGGEAGFCKLGDGSMVDEWSFVYVPKNVLGH